MATETFAVWVFGDLLVRHFESITDALVAYDAEPDEIWHTLEDGSDMRIEKHDLAIMTERDFNEKFA